jgi:formylglycine-generating enzyme required for sulfatase activity
MRIRCEAHVVSRSRIFIIGLYQKKPSLGSGFLPKLDNEGVEKYNFKVLSFEKECKMKIPLKFLSLFMLVGVLSVPVSVSAQGVPGDILLDFVKIEGGFFIMGSPASEVSRHKDEIQRQVMVGAFYMAKNEVTQREYETIMRTNPSKFHGASLPVEQVSWYDAVAYCNARSIIEGLTPAYVIRETEILWDHDADGYRLPTEAEWEYACRAGTKGAYHTGGNITTNLANFDGNYPYNRHAKGRYRARTTTVRSFAPNDWGLYDMHGNVYEWCWDQYKEYSNTGTLDGFLWNPAVMRGGSWYSEARFLRSANRVSADRTAKTDYIGFRIVRSAL